MGPIGQFISNGSPLSTHGEQALRRQAIDIIEHALSAADPYRAVNDRVELRGDRLIVDGASVPLPKHGRVIFIGAGKASFPIASAIEGILGDRLTAGSVICKYGQAGKLSRIRLIHAAHPIPDETGARATRDIVDLVSRTGPDDIVISGITGGSSALMGLPADAIPLDDYADLTRMLLGCGANVIEINAVRKHIAAVGGGRLMNLVHPRARLINLTVSDVIGDPLDYITDPTVPDTSTLGDARNTLSRYGLWERVPASVSAYLREGGGAIETPKNCGTREPPVNALLLSAEVACDAAAWRGREIGLEAMILSTRFEGESQHLGRTFAAMAIEVARRRRPVAPPALLIGGGETVVRLGDGSVGNGGPNQEFAVAAAIELDGIRGTVIAGVDSDGTDGPSQLAGAMVDGETMARARRFGVDLRLALEAHDTSPALMQIEDAIFTGATGTNVNDLKFALIGA